MIETMRIVKLILMCALVTIIAACSGPKYISIATIDNRKIFFSCENKVILSTNFNHRKLIIHGSGCIVEQLDKNTLRISPDSGITQCKLQFYSKSSRNDSMLICESNYYYVGSPEAEISSINEYLKVDTVQIEKLMNNPVIKYRYDTYMFLHESISYDIFHIQESAIIGEYHDINQTLLPVDIFKDIYSKYHPGDKLILANIVFHYNGINSLSSGKEIIIR